MLVEKDLSILKPCQFEFLRSRHFQEEDDHSVTIIYRCKCKDAQISLMNEDIIADEEFTKTILGIVTFCDSNCTQNY